jgi:hypothetical protein
MSSGAEILLAVWPNGIPPQDYKRAVNVMKAMSSRPQPAERPMSPQSAKRGKDDAYSITASKAQVARVMEALKTGPATAKELVEVAKVPNPTIYAALRQAGAVVVGSMKRTTGFGRASNLWALPAGK